MDRMFIARRKDNDELVKGYIWQKNGRAFIMPYNMRIDYSSLYRELKATAYEVTPNTIGIASGISDCNGREIFEKDILKSYDANTTLIVDFCDDRFIATDMATRVIYTAGYFRNFEVIGHI